MLDVERITAAMHRQGLSPAALAAVCEVRGEVVSKWLNREVLPRPRKLAVLAETLQLSVEQLLGAASRPEPVVAYRARREVS